MQLKNIIFLLSILIVGSCSKNEFEPETTQFDLPKAKQIITTYIFSNEPDTVSFVYNADGLISEKHFRSQTSYYNYENGLLDREVNFYNSFPDTSHYEWAYEYDENKLTKIVIYDRPGTPELTAVSEFDFDYSKNQKVIVINTSLLYDYKTETHYFYEDKDIVKVENLDQEGEVATEIFYTYTDLLRPISYSQQWISNSLDSRHLPASVKIIDHTGLLDLVCQFELEFTYETDNEGRPIKSDNGCYSVEFDY